MNFYFNISFGLARQSTRFMKIGSRLLGLLSGWNHRLIQIFLLLLLGVQLVPLSLLLCFLVVADIKRLSPCSWSLWKRGICIISRAHKTSL